MKLKELNDYVAPYQKYTQGGLTYYFSNIKGKQFIFVIITYGVQQSNSLISAYGGLRGRARTGGTEISFGLITTKVEDPSDIDLGMLISSGAITDADTGTGDAFLIFSTALHIFKEYVSENKPSLMMIGSRENRKNLYRMFIKKALPSFPEYKVVEGDMMFIAYKGNSFEER